MWLYSNTHTNAKAGVCKTAKSQMKIAVYNQSVYEITFKWDKEI